MQQAEQVYVKRSIQIPETMDRLWAALARKTGVNKTAALINALRELAKREGVSVGDGEERS